MKLDFAVYYYNYKVLRSLFVVFIIIIVMFVVEYIADEITGGITWLFNKVKIH